MYDDDKKPHVTFAKCKYSMRSNHMHDADSAESYHNLLLTTFNIFEIFNHPLLSTYAMTLHDVLNPGVEGEQGITLIP